jgi:cell division protein FtsZ
MRKAEPEKVVVSLDKQVVAEVAAPAPAPAFVPVDLTPTLMVEPVAPVVPVAPVAVAPVTIAPVVVEEPKAVAPVVAVDATQHFLQLVEEQPAPEPVFTWQDTRAERQEEPVIQLVIKNEEPAKAPEPVVMKIGERILSADEVEEKRRFEEQKRALEERAERLRRMSFNIKENQTPDDIENVPAYMRKNMKLDNGVSSSDSFYSGYTVGHNDQNNSHQASIQTINTFLDGKKPD